MAIAFDAFTSGGSFPASFSHTIAGPKAVLWVPITTTVAEGTPGGITANGRALTLVGTIDNAAATKRLSVWKLLVPDIGANTIAIDNTGLSGSRPVAISYNFCHPTLQPDAQHSTGNTSNVSTRTDSVTVTAPGAWTLLFTENALSAVTAGSGTLRGNNSDLGVIDSGTLVGLGAQSLQAVASGATDWASFIVSLTPANSNMMGFF